MAITKSTKRTTRATSRGTGKTTRQNRPSWTMAMVTQAKQMARQGLSADQIGRKLSPRRTGSSVRQKFHTIGFSIPGGTATRSTRRRAA